MIDEVSELIRQVATVEVLDRFRQLNDGDIDEKSPGDLVTIADRNCELALIPELKAIRDVPVIGEESVAADPTLRDALIDADAAWVVDPVDGTANFVAGSTDFVVMLAFIEQGRTTAAWIWHPPTDDMVTAQAGAGTWRGDTQLRAPDSSADPYGILKTKYIAEPMRSRIIEAAASITRAPNRGCAGVEYLDLVAGKTNLLSYWRTHPWDHAPGTLIAAEAGLRVGRLDGSDYFPGDTKRGLLTARADLWDPLARALDVATAEQSEPRTA